MKPYLMLLYPEYIKLDILQDRDDRKQDPVRDFMVPTALITKT